MDLAALLALEPAVLREQHGIRFHHFHDLKGRLVATIVSKPAPGQDDVVLVAAAIASKKDAATRKRGREIALGRLEAGQRLVFEIDDLKRCITERTILQEFSGGRRLKLRPRAPFVPRERKSNV
jgi:hypothetical protein